MRINSLRAYSAKTASVAKRAKLAQIRAFVLLEQRQILVVHHITVNNNAKWISSQLDTVILPDLASKSATNKLAFKHRK